MLLRLNVTRTVIYFVILYHRLYILLQYCTLFYCQRHAVTLINEKFDGIWTSCGLRPRFRCGYGGFGFYDHSDIMTKMAWSQGGHIKRRLLYLTLAISSEACRVRSNRNIRTRDFIHANDFFVSLLFIIFTKRISLSCSN